MFLSFTSLPKVAVDIMLRVLLQRQLPHLRYVTSPSSLITRCSISRDQVLIAQTDPRVPLLIKAGPGSGKTLTLLHRILFLLPTLLPTENILLLTFSKAAVKEMQTRLRPHMDDKKNDVVRVSTFHSFCYQVIRDHYSFLQFTSSPRVVFRDVRMNILLYAIDKCSPLNAELLLLNEFQRENLLWRIQKLKHAEDADKFILEYSIEKHELDVFVAYQSRMKELNFIEFADMVPLADELFKAHPSILNQYVQKYKYVLCDEFQDTNAPQRRILFSLAPEGRISVVGDPNQLIYAFRGADLANFEEFEKTFSNISSAAFKTTTLEVNYRSTAAIVRVTNEILRCRVELGSSVLSSEMRARDANGPGSPVLIVECLGGEEAEWSFILSHIESLLSSGKATSPSCVAILCRSNSVARRIRDFLRESRSLHLQPCQDDKEENEEFCDASHLNTYIAMMELALSPTNNELCVNALPEELVALGEVNNCIVRCRQRKNHSRGGTPHFLLEELRSAAGSCNKLREWLQDIEKLISTLEDNDVIFPDFVAKSLLSCGVAAHQNTKRICPISNSAQSEDTTFTLSVQLQALKEEADNWHANSRRSFQQTLLEQTRAFIGHVKSLLSEDGVLRTKADNKFNEVEKVWVGTIHKAKGRQFEAVVVPCATDKVFGSYPQAFKAHDDGRQLLYVAASRAEKHLCFTYQGAYNLETQRQRMTPLLTSSAASPFTQLKQHPLTLKDEIVETILG